VSPRDFELLRWVGDQYAITLPQLALLMGRSEHAARWLRARWQRAGWVEGRQLLVGAPVFVWLTGAGIRLADSPYKPWRPNAGALAHVAAVSDVRLWLAGRRPEAEWVSERALLRERGGQRRVHLPDALVRAEGQEVPVEVELTLKKRERLEAIVSGHLATYPAVWYFAAPAPRRALEAIARRHGAERVQVLDLPAPTLITENHLTRNGVRP
jgi:hypothetical protein